MFEGRQGLASEVRYGYLIPMVLELKVVFYYVKLLVFYP